MWIAIAYRRCTRAVSSAIIDEKSTVIVRRGASATPGGNNLTDMFCAIEPSLYTLSAGVLCICYSNQCEECVDTYNLLDVTSAVDHPCSLLPTY